MAELLAPVAYRRNLALDWAKARGPGWRAAPAAARAIVVLKEGPLSELLSGRLQPVLGVALPDPGRVAGSERLQVLWQGPHEWLLLADADEAASLLPRLREAAAGVTAAIVDLSDRLAQLRIGGAQAAAVLAQGCGLEFSSLVPGSVVRTRFLQFSVTLQPVDGGIEMTFERLHLPFLLDWFSTVSESVLEQA